MFILPIIYSAILINIEEAYKNYRYYDNPFITILITIIVLICFCFLLQVNILNCYYISLVEKSQYIILGKNSKIGEIRRLVLFKQIVHY